MAQAGTGGSAQFVSELASEGHRFALHGHRPAIGCRRFHTPLKWRTHLNFENIPTHSPACVCCRNLSPYCSAVVVLVLFLRSLTGWEIFGFLVRMRKKCYLFSFSSGGVIEACLFARLFVAGSSFGTVRNQFLCFSLFSRGVLGGHFILLSETEGRNTLLGDFQSDK